MKIISVIETNRNVYQSIVIWCHGNYQIFGLHAGKVIKANKSRNLMIDTIELV
jgi:hypothetical protein